MPTNGADSSVLRRPYTHPIKIMGRHTLRRGEGGKGAWCLNAPFLMEITLGIVAFMAFATGQVMVFVAVAAVVFLAP